jgi:hypothetical protein
MEEPIMDLLIELIASFDPGDPRFRPTELYNESWLVKLILHQASRFDDDEHPLGFLPGSTWFSEALLPTRFKAQYQGDPLAESRTHADGIIGHFRVGARAKTDFELLPGAEQFTVVEAKMGSPLATGTSRAPGYDQAARSVACMADALARGSIDPSSLQRLDFVVAAPRDAIKRGVFHRVMQRDSIRSKVKKRVSAYGGEHEDWHTTYFEPVIERIRLHCLSWESAIEWVSGRNPEVKDQLAEFYGRCFEFN